MVRRALKKTGVKWLLALSTPTALAGTYRAQRLRTEWRHMATLETVDLNGLTVKTKTLRFIGKKFLHVLALIPLELDHLAHLGVDDDGAIASKLLLNDLEDLFLVKLLG
jgi:hypothetical protein